MPFEKGNKLSPGRRGYEIEYNRLKKMEKILDKYLVKVDRILEGEEKPRDAKIIQLLSADIRKIIDKLHVSKQDVTTAGQPIEGNTIVLTNFDETDSQ